MPNPWELTDFQFELWAFEAFHSTEKRKMIKNKSLGKKPEMKNYV